MSILTEADRELMPMALRSRGVSYGHKMVSGRLGTALVSILFHQTTQPFHPVIPNVTFIAGIATGKTTAVAASYMIDCITIPYFRALNTSVTAKQAELPFEMVQGWIEGNSAPGASDR